MAKRARRNRKRRQQAPVTPVMAAEPATKVEDNGQQSTADPFIQEYAYVLGDLRRVLILAAVMFLLLIVLNLFLQ